MGLSSATISSEALKFCIFDLRRGQHEGQELDKILFFFPADLPFSTQLSVIGLSEGLITFTRIFSPEAACEIIEAELHSHIFYEAEPDIWMVLVVEKSKDTEAIWRIDALHRVLKEVHSLFVMFHGSIRALLDKEPGGGLIRTHLYSFIMDYLNGKALFNNMLSISPENTFYYNFVVKNISLEVPNCQHVKSGHQWICAAGVMLKLLYQMIFIGFLLLEQYEVTIYQTLLMNFPFEADFFVGKKIHLPNFRDSLKERGTVQMLTVSREAAIEVQSLVRVLESCAGSTSCYSLILFQDLLVSTTLSPDDSINLFTYAILRLAPRALSSGSSSWSYLRKGNTASHAAALAPMLENSGSGLDQIYGSHYSPPIGDNNYHVVRPLQHDKWSRGKDGFLVTDIWGSEVQVGNLVRITPTIWLQHTEEKMYLCVHQHKNLTVILLVPVTSILNGEQGVSMLKQQVLENASAKIFKVEDKLSKGWAGENAYHVSGYRYLLVDGDRSISRASPLGKVATLTKESLVATSKLREEVDLEKSRARWDDPDHEKELEICIRAKNSAWVIARITRGKELYMVLEKANETLVYASDAVEKFSNNYCNGAFSLD